MAWRELLMAHLEGPTHEPRRADDSPARVLERALQLGEEGVEREARAQSLEDLRAVQPGWDACRTLLAGAVRVLRRDLEEIETYGPYAVLGVAVDASEAEIKRAYRDLCLRHHPDKGGDTAAFQALQQAHERILEDRRRGVRPPRPGPAAPPQAGASREGAREARSSTAREGPAGPAGARQAPRAPSAPKAPGASWPPEEAGGGEQGGNQTPQRGRGSRPASPACAAAEEAASGEEAAAGACVADALRILRTLQLQAADGAESARAACEAADAAVAVVVEAAGCQASAEDHLVAQEAVRGLLSAMRSIMEGTEAAAKACVEASTRVVAIGVLDADGERAEAVVQASLNCATQGTTTSDAAASCEASLEEVIEALRAVADEDLSDADLGPDGVAAIALKLLASTARRGREVASEAVEAAAAAASALSRALLAAQASAVHAAAGPNVSPAWRPGCSSPRASSRTAAGARERDAPPSPQPPPEPAAAPETAGRPAGRPPAAPGAQPGASPGAPRGSSPGAPPSAGSARSRARSGSAGARGRKEALVRRRLEAFEELSSLNSEACKLQRRLHDYLLRTPLLLPTATKRQRARVFEVAAEYLHESLCALRAQAGPSAVEVLAWLPGNKACDSALRDVGVGALHLAALLDIESLRTVLQGPFLSGLLEARPSEGEAVRAAVARATEVLSAWVSAKPP